LFAYMQISAFAVEPPECKKTIDSLKQQVIIYKFKIERVKYYLKIVNRKPSQSKFLKGWITRAVK